MLLLLAGRLLLLLLLLLLLDLASLSDASDGGTVLLPTWTPSYRMNESTMIQACNAYGTMDLATVTKWAIVNVISFNNMSGPGARQAKRGWLAEHPMNEEQDEVLQARLIQAARNDTARYPGAVPGRTWVYRQSVKAEPWDQTVRTKISDPAWSAGFFLHYGKNYNYSAPICKDANMTKPGCNTWPACDASSPPKCSKMYHDQVGRFAPFTTHGALDCGTQPCGEYLYDYRNGSMLREWMLREHYFGPSAMGDPDVSGLFIDDDWNAKGLTEEGPGWQEEMELSPADLVSMQKEYATTIQAVREKIVAQGGFIWQMVTPSGPFPARMEEGNNWLALNNRSKAQCTSWHRANCVPAAPLSQLPVMHAFSIKAKGAFAQLPSAMQDISSFLLTRGEYAWMGHEWGGCTMDYAYPSALLHEDYGRPLTHDCQEVGTSEVFTRQWTNATVSIDCKNLSAKIEMKDGRVLRSTDPTQPERVNTLSGGGYGGRGYAIPQS